MRLRTLCVPLAAPLCTTTRAFSEVKCNYDGTATPPWPAAGEAPKYPPARADHPLPKPRMRKTQTEWMFYHGHGGRLGVYGPSREIADFEFADGTPSSISGRRYAFKHHQDYLLVQLIRAGAVVERYAAHGLLPRVPGTAEQRDWDPAIPLFLEDVDEHGRPPPTPLQGQQQQQQQQQQGVHFSHMVCTPRTAGENTITVAVRKRPKIIPKESDENDVVRCEGSTTIVVYEPKTKLDLTPVIEPNVFSFDHVFDDTSTNADVYETCCRPLLQDVKEGGGAVIFAFGQTGSGKTHTMLGRAGVCQGLYGFTVAELLTTGAASALVVSFYEVYGAKLFDLLNGRAAVKMLQDEFRNIHIVGLSEREVSTEEELRQLMSEGQMLRASGITHANDRSSRSHAILGIKVRMQGGTVPCGRITFVDLAGSERAADTADADIKVRREGAEINKSLLALKECIRAMSMRKKHIPFRASKLTQILSESFTGRCKTCVIANISPCQRHCEDTLNTLRYAHRIKELKCPTNGMLEHEVPTPCPNCGLPVFTGDKHVCLRMNVQCPHCRQEMDKQDLEAHLTECKEFPIRCPHCNEHLFRGELVRHNRRCVRFPVRCPYCSAHVLRNALEKHILAECAAAKEKCRYCGELFPRHSLASHELECDMMKVACSFCLQYVRKGRLEAHTVSCWKNPNRKVLPTPLRSESSPSVAPSTEPDSRVSREKEQQGQQLQQQQQQQQQEQLQQQRRLIGGRVPRQLKLPRRSGSTCNGDGPSSSSSSPSPSRVRSDGEHVCPYARYGCSDVVTDSNLATHLTAAVAKHLRLVSIYADRMDVENAALRRLVVTNNSQAPETQ